MTDEEKPTFKLSETPRETDTTKDPALSRPEEEETETSNVSEEETISDTSASRSLTPSEISDRRYAEGIEEDAKRAEAIATGDPVEREKAMTGLSVPNEQIQAARDKDAYVRDGNVLWPPPVPRPVGASPSLVEEALTPPENGPSERDMKAEVVRSNLS